MSRLAELVSVKLDSPNIIQQEWEKFVFKMGDFNWHNRMYFTVNDFTDYFRNKLQEIIDVVQLPYLDITVQTHDTRLHNNPIPLNVTHIDGYRSTNITIPVYAEPEEKINWHGEPTDIILQSSTYSTKHPSLVNVGEVHTVSLVPNARRILIQLSYRQTFTEMLELHSDNFKVYT
jgi:hypothetical protein